MSDQNIFPSCFHKYFLRFFFSVEDLQMVCGFSCEDLISMFKELRSLGVVVKELSNELRQMVRKTSRLSYDRMQETICCLLASCPFVYCLTITTCLSTRETLDTY